MKAGAKLCYWSALFTILSAIGMIISQTMENHYKTCDYSELGVIPTFSYLPLDL